MKPWRPVTAGDNNCWAAFKGSCNWPPIWWSSSGFTGASSVGLLIGQRNLLANDQQLARQSIALCDKAIRGLQDDPARLEQELLFHSNATTTPSTIRTSFYATLTPEALAWCP